MPDKGKALGIIFDLDGTLWDATGMAARIWNAVFEAQGLALRLTARDVREQMGKTMEEIGAAFFPELEAARRDEIMDLLGIQEVLRMHEGGDRLYDGVPEVLEALAKRHALSIVSNCQRDYARTFIRTHGFEKYFSDYEESGRSGMVKADNIRLVMARNALPRAVYVGDTEGDMRAAQQAGAAFVFARYGFGAAEGAEYCIDDIRQLPGLIDRIQQKND